MLKLLYLLCFLSQSPDGDIIKVIINPEKDKEAILYLSDFADEVSYIKLQTNDACMLEKISKVLIDGENVFISSLHSNFSRLLLFNSNGLFIKEIGFQGRGPGEFNAILDFDLDRSEKIVYILDTPGNVLVYDYLGKYLKTRKLESKPSRLLVFNNALYFFTPWPNYILNKGYAIQTRQLSNENMDSFLLSRKSFLYERTPGTIIYTNFFAGVNEHSSLEFFEEKFDTLYNINTKNKIEPKFVIDLKNDMPRDLYKMSDYTSALKEHRYNTLSNLISVKNYLFFKIITPQPATTFYYSYEKSTKEIRMHNVTNDKQYFFNDIDGGFTFKPEGVAESGVLYSAIDCYKLLEHFANGRSSKVTVKDKTGHEALKKLVTSVKIDDNPVLMLINLK